jgi:Zn-dependent M28 family amino/carboxypeptidase
LFAVLSVGCSSLPEQINEVKSNKLHLDIHQVNNLTKHLKVLSADNMAGRKFASKENIRAQNYIVSSLKSSDVLPFQKRFRHSFQHKSLLSTKLGTNIIGMVKGTVFPEQFIVLSAHYDHLGKIGSKVYNGTDDNASGTAAALTFAQTIVKNQLKHSVIFLFTDGEEVNLLGAKAFVSQQSSLLSQIILNINIDMIGGSFSTKRLHYIENRLETILPNKNEFLMELPNYSSISLKKGFKRKLYQSNVSTSWINASDHAVFNRNQIPFIYFGVGEHKNYHTTHDDFSHANLSFFIKASQSILQFLYLFDENIE